MHFNLNGAFQFSIGVSFLENVRKSAGTCFLTFSVPCIFKLWEVMSLHGFAKQHLHGLCVIQKSFV